MQANIQAGMVVHESNVMIVVSKVVDIRDLEYRSEQSTVTPLPLYTTPYTNVLQAMSQQRS